MSSHLLMSCNLCYINTFLFSIIFKSIKVTITRLLCKMFHTVSDTSQIRDFRLEVINSSNSHGEFEELIHFYARNLSFAGFILSYETTCTHTNSLQVLHAVLLFSRSDTLLTNINKSNYKKKKDILFFFVPAFTYDRYFRRAQKSRIQNNGQIKCI